MSISKTSQNKVKTPRNVKYIKTYGGISEYKLDNGLRVLLKADQNAPLFSWQVWYKVGSRNEKSGTTGIAHYLEHMMFKGTDLFDKGEIAQSIQLQGGIFNAFTSDDTTAYFENFSPENLELAIKLEANRMRKAKLDAEELESERSVIISELEGGDNHPGNVLYKALKASAYHVHPYHSPVIGWTEDLHNIDRDVMKDFYDTYYQPNNATAILVGKFDEELALELISKYFGKYKSSKKPYPKVSKEPEQKGLRSTTVHKEGLIKLLGVAYHIPEFGHEDFPALNVIADTLYGGTSSRAYKDLIDSNLAVDVSGYAESGIDPGVFRVIVNMSPDADIKKIGKILDQELEKIKEGITEDELTRAKARIEASSIYERDGVYSEAMQIGYFNILGKWEDYVDWVDIVSKVTNEDIKRVAKKYFTNSNKTVVQLLPEKPNEKLTDTAFASNNGGSDKEIKIAEHEQMNKVVQAYHSTEADTLDPKKLRKLLDIAKPKYSKGKVEEKSLDLNLKTLKFDNGIEVTFREDHSLPLVYINALYFAGSVNNPADKPGLSAHVSEMLERGSKKHNKFEMSDLLDVYGADINFHNRQETAEMHLSTLSKNLEKTLALLKENLEEPAFLDKELKKLKKENIDHIKQEDDYLRNVNRRELNRTIYPKGHPFYSYTPEEKIKSIGSFTTKDIKDFYNKYYTGKNLRLSIVGDITEDEIKNKVIPIFANWNKDASSNAPEIPLIEAKEPIEKINTYEDKHQVEITMGHNGEIDRKHKDFYALLLANYALGGSALSSRLGTIVRDEHGFAYSIRSGFNSTLGAGAFTVSLGCNPKNVKDAVKLSKDVISNFIKNGISETELEVTKSYMTGSFSGRHLSSSEDISHTLTSMMLYKLEPEYLEKYADIINGISIAEVNAAAKKHIKPEMLNVIISGPKFE